MLTKACHIKYATLGPAIFLNSFLVSILAWELGEELVDVGEEEMGVGEEGVGVGGGSEWMEGEW